jgi:hypothetical protein
MRTVLGTILVLLVSVPACAQPKRRVVDKKFWLAVGTACALAVADIELTQQCIQRHVCREANPLLGQSRQRAYAVNAAILVPMTIWTYHLKKDQNRNGGAKGDISWWLPSVIKSGSHVTAIGVTLFLTAKARELRTHGTGASMLPNANTVLQPAPLFAAQSWRITSALSATPADLQPYLYGMRQRAIQESWLTLPQDVRSRSPRQASGGSSPER